TACFWLTDLATGAVLRSFPVGEKPVTRLAFLAGGRQVAALDGRGVVTVVDTTTGAKVREVGERGHRLMSLAASPDGVIVATGGQADTGAASVNLWDAAGRRVRPLYGPVTDVTAVAYSPDGRTVAGGDATTVHVWDAATGHKLRRLDGATDSRDGHIRAVRSLAFSPDGRTIAAGNLDGAFRAWEVATGRLVDGTDSFGTPALVFRDARTVVIGHYETVRLRDLAARATVNDFGPRSRMTYLGFTPDGRSVVTADHDSPIRTWDAADGRLVSQKAWSGSNHAPLVSPDGRWVAFTEEVDDDRFTRVGEVATGRILWRLPDKAQCPQAFSADGRRLVTYCEIYSPEGTRLSVWDMATGTKVGQIAAGQTWLNTVALTADGRTLFAAEVEKPHRVRAWDVATGRVVREFALPSGRRAQALTVSQAIRISAGGRRLAAATDD